MNPLQIVNVIELVARLVRLIVEKQEDPEAYLTALIAGIEKDAQALAREKFG